MLTAVAALALTAGSVQAQTNTAPATSFDTNNPPTVEGGLAETLAAIKNNTNILFETHLLYAPKLAKKTGGGLGVFYPVNTYVYTGVRIDYVNGGL